MSETHAHAHHGHPVHEPDSHQAAGNAVPEPVGLRRKISDEQINALELIIYEGPIHIIHTHKDTLHAVSELGKEHLLGFDTETRPAFQRGVSYPPALLQLAGRHAVYLFQLSSTKLPGELADILANPNIIKAGVAIDRDIKELRTLTDFLPAGFTDLGVYAKNCGIQHHGLRGLAALMLGRRISKGAKLTRWDSPKLPEHALQYAATDAWIGRRIYEEMEAQGCAEMEKEHRKRAPEEKKDRRAESHHQGHRVQE